MRHPTQSSCGRAMPCAVAVAAVLVTLAASAFAAPKPVDGKVADVTLYRGQAQVTRTIDLAEGKGPLELVVGNLPENVQAASLFAEGSPGVDVRAVRYRRRAVGEAPREEVRRVEGQIEDVNDQIVFGLQALALGDNEDADAAFGTAQTATLTVDDASTTKQFISDASAAITVAGSPQAGDTILLRIFRALKAVS